MLQNGLVLGISLLPILRVELWWIFVTPNLYTAGKIRAVQENYCVEIAIGIDSSPGLLSEIYLTLLQRNRRGTYL